MTPTSLPKRFTLCFGDGIGPEITQSVLKIFDKAQVPLSFDIIEVGEKIYRKGITSGIEDSSFETILKNYYFLKAPITTPQGGGYKSLNVTIRKTLNLFANVRPCVSYHPYVKSLNPRMNLVIIRENEEDLYAAIEYRQTPQFYKALKVITWPGTLRIIQFAFEYARATGRRKVTCMTKDNILKLTDGLFHKVFEQVGTQYPEIEKEHLIIDIGSAKIATAGEKFDVVVTLNLYGDILSDIAAEVAGSIGMAPSANIGQYGAMFEAVHGSAPDIAGLNRANPSGLLLAAVDMLVHMGYTQQASLIHNAWLSTLEDGYHTADIQTDKTKKVCSTTEFTQAVIDHLGQKPQRLVAVNYSSRPQIKLDCDLNLIPKPQNRQRVGADFYCYHNQDVTSLVDRLQKALKPLNVELQMVTNRGVKVWPGGRSQTFCSDEWRCRCIWSHDLTPWQVAQRITEQGLDVTRVENLYDYDGQPGYSLGQGQ